jgi:hypothetical protein
MEMENLSKHASDDELLAYLYAGETGAGSHIAGCRECRFRLEGLRNSRAEIEAQYRPEEDVSPEFLASQRRHIYARIDRGDASNWRFMLRRWTSPLAAAALVVAAGITLVEQRPHPSAQHPKISDEQLAVEIDQFASDVDTEPTAPLRALFEE